MIQIVKFNDETYGIRKGNILIGYRFLDREYDWSSVNPGPRYFNNWSKFKTLEEARAIMGNYKDRGTPILVWKGRSG